MNQSKYREIGQQTALKLLERLHDSESRYESLITTLNDVVFEADRLTLNLISNGWVRLLGHSISDSLGRSLIDFVADAELPSFQDWIDQLIEGGDSTDTHTTQLMMAGQGRKWVEINASFSRSSGLLTGVIRDVSLRMELEERIRQQTEELNRRTNDLIISEERLRFAMEASQDGIWDWHINTGQTYCSPSYYRMLGYATGSLGSSVDELFLQLLHPDDRLKTFDAIGQLIRDPGHYQIQFRMRNQVGKYCWIESKGKVVETDASGSPLRAIGTHTDITHRKEAEIALAESEQRFKDMADSAPVMIWLADTDKLCTYFNSTWLEFTGRSLDQEVGNGWAEGVHPDDFDQCLATYIQSFDQRLAFTMDYRLRHHDGQYRWIQDSGTPRFAADGTFLGYIGSCIDITERKNAENAIRELNSNLEQKVKDRTAELAHASAAKSDFIAHMSHEIRTPLNVILGLTQILAKKSCSTELEPMVNKIGEAGATLLHIINDVLDLSKIEAGQITLDQSPFQLSTVLKRIHDLLQTTAQSKAIELVVEPPPPLPAALLGDAQRLGQVLINLTANALKFTEHGMVKITIAMIHQTNEMARLRFEIKDTGIGIPEETQRHLFEPFNQGSAKVGKHYGGTGLGLVISKRLVESMKGLIGLESLPGEGSLFWFEIPFPLVESETLKIQQDTMPLAEELRLTGYTILAVDDNNLNQYLIEELLKREGATVVLSGDGQNALNLLTQNPDAFDLVLMDVQMPVMDGLSATKEIRANPRIAHLPVIALSAGVLTSERDAAFHAGVDGFLSKPLDAEEVVRVLMDHLKDTPLSLTSSDPASAQEQEISPWEETPGLDPERAREIAGLDPKFYVELLGLFLKEFDTAASEGRAYIAGHQFNEANGYFRKLKGTAANIGAYSVMEIAKALEDLSRAPEETQAMLLLLDQLDDSMTSLASNCAEWLQRKDIKC